MEKNKRASLEQPDSLEEKIVSRMKTSLQDFEAGYPVKTPDLSFFKRVIEEQEESPARREWPETLSFLLIAILILSLSGIVLNKLPQLFFVCQAVLFVFLSLFAIRQFMNGKKSVYDE
ncbi:DUF5345 family protein [Bacillus massiliglaciei]|uniref:DUF5345 family protein n=1 Tax=Bacillus massiliglaciei TaxID=1816693 RepID=UPI000DA62653|nr:DUF5345 family protein [Bacillus massiliglaciei]